MFHRSKRTYKIAVVTIAKSDFDKVGKFIEQAIVTLDTKDEQI